MDVVLTIISGFSFDSDSSLKSIIFACKFNCSFRSIAFCFVRFVRIMFA